MNQLINLFPNLQELQICYFTDQDVENFKQLIKTIVCEHKHLRKLIFLSYHNNLMSNDDLVEMNSKRSKLIEPSLSNLVEPLHLIIETNTNVIDTKLKFISIMKSMQSYCLTCQMFGKITIPDYEYAIDYLKTLSINDYFTF